MDSIGDFLTILRNASQAKKADCSVIGSKMNESIAKILQASGLISRAEIESDAQGHRVLKVFLKYIDGVPGFIHIHRISRPGCRRYYGFKEIPLALNGLGLSILSTSRGVLSHREARRQKVGGELLCQIW